MPAAVRLRDHAALASSVPKPVTALRSASPIPIHAVNFMRPSRFAVDVLPAFGLPELAEPVKSNPAPALAPLEERKAQEELSRAAERKLAAQLEATFTKKAQEFSGQLERRLDLFYEQTAMRLDALSQDAAGRFSDALNDQMKEALAALMADWAEQNRVLVDAECHAALDRFAARLDGLSSSHLQNHRKEMLNLTANLKTRLRGVAHALQELGPTSPQS